MRTKSIPRSFMGVLFQTENSLETNRVCGWTLDGNPYIADFIDSFTEAEFPLERLIKCYDNPFLTHGVPCFEWEWDENI